MSESRTFRHRGQYEKLPWTVWNGNAWCTLLIPVWQICAKEICHYLNRKYHLTYHPENETLVTVGGSEAIDLAIRATVNPGDEVLIVEPSFVCYKPIVELMHGVAVPISTKLKNKFKLTPEELRSHITERTKMLILPYRTTPPAAL
mgnify:CR=1 FL=1